VAVYNLFVISVFVIRCHIYIYCGCL